MKYTVPGKPGIDLCRSFAVLLCCFLFTAVLNANSFVLLDKKSYLSTEEKEIVLQQLNKHFSDESDILILLSDNLNALYSDSVFLNWQTRAPEKGICLIMDCGNKDVRLFIGTRWENYLDIGFSEKLINEDLCPLIYSGEISKALNICITELSVNLSEGIIAEKTFLAGLEENASGGGKQPSRPFSANPFILAIWFSAILLYLAFGMFLFYRKKKASKKYI